MSDSVTERATALRELVRGSAGPMARAFLEAERGMPARLAQLVVLHHLAESGPATVSKLAALVDLSPSAASHMVERLVEHGFVTRAEDPVDRRLRVVTATEAGRQSVASAVEVVVRIVNRWLEKLPGDERKKLVAGLAAAFPTSS